MRKSGLIGLLLVVLLVFLPVVAFGVAPDNEPYGSVSETKIEVEGEVTDSGTVGETLTAQAVEPGIRSNANLFDDMNTHRTGPAVPPMDSRSASYSEQVAEDSMELHIMSEPTEWSVGGAPRFAPGGY